MRRISLHMKCEDIKPCEGAACFDVTGPLIDELAMEHDPLLQFFHLKVTAFDLPGSVDLFLSKKELHGIGNLFISLAESIGKYTTDEFGEDRTIRALDDMVMVLEVLNETLTDLANRGRMRPLKKGALETRDDC